MAFRVLGPIMIHVHSLDLSFAYLQFCMNDVQQSQSSVLALEPGLEWNDFPGPLHTARKALVNTALMDTVINEVIEVQVCIHSQAACNRCALRKLLSILAFS